MNKKCPKLVISGEEEGYGVYLEAISLNKLVMSSRLPLQMQPMVPKRLVARLAIIMIKAKRIMRIGRKWIFSSYSVANSVPSNMIYPQIPSPIMKMSGENKNRIILRSIKHLLKVEVTPSLSFEYTIFVDKVNLACKFKRVWYNGNI